jgi:hypothetical protein
LLGIMKDWNLSGQDVSDALAALEALDSTED